MPYVVQPVDPGEAEGLARTMMSAFHENRHWALLWPNMSLEEIIDGCTQRLPRNLVKDRTYKRHQKVVDEVSGEIVGYARWIVPKGFEELWLEAQVPEPTTEEHHAYELRWQGATVDGRSKGVNSRMISEMSGPLDAEEERIMKGETWLCKYGMSYNWIPE